MADQRPIYLKFLPAIYSQPKGEIAPEPFIDSYLRIFEKIWSGISSPESQEDQASSDRPEDATTPADSLDIMDKKGFGEALDILADLFYPRFSFLFPEDTETFIPPMPRLGDDQDKESPIDFSQFQTYICTANERWLDGFLNWLAGWMALVPGKKWSIDKKRKAIARIFPIYRKRGTKQGLKELLELYLSEDEPGEQQELQGGGGKKTERIHIYDRAAAADRHYMRLGDFRVQESPAAEDPVLDGFQPYSFVVEVTLFTRDFDRIRHQRKILENIIEQEKPAHTRHRLIIKTLALEVGESVIGKKTVIGEIKSQGNA